MNPDLPSLAGEGPAGFSTCADLAVQPGWIADVNCYYADLGVAPSADRKALRDAYLAADGANSTRLTYVLKQLLDPEVRAVYDRMTLGHPFMDIYVYRAIVAEAIRQMRSRGAVMSDPLASVMGVVYESRSNDEPEGVDQSGLEGQDIDAPPEHSLDRSFGYSFYQWRSDSHDPSPLFAWQAHLVRAFHERGVHTTLSVGYLGQDPMPYRLARVGYRLVAFLNDQVVPTARLASAFADELISTEARLSDPIR